MKSEKLKKFENELTDLKQWLKLGLVPKKDLEKHQKEIESLHLKIEEEKERLRYLKESGEAEEYTVPKRNQAKQAYQEPHSLPDIDSHHDSEMTDAGLELESDSYESDSLSASDFDEGGEDRTMIEEEDENPFSDRNRWRRGIQDDPEANDW
jgi:hypothetical protein